MIIEPGRTAYEARHAGEKLGPRGTADRWEDLTDAARAVWRRVEVACAAPRAPASADLERLRADAMSVLERVIDTANYVTLGAHQDARTALALLTALPASGAAARGERARHVKRGTEYEVLHRGVELQVAAEHPFCDGHVGLFALEEGSRLVIYRGADGRIWAREGVEFDDGRFERLDGIERPAP